MTWYVVLTLDLITNIGNCFFVKAVADFAVLYRPPSVNIAFVEESSNCLDISSENILPNKNSYLNWMSRNCHYTGCILCQCQIEGMIPKVICKKQTMQLPHTACGTSRRSILTDPLFHHIALIFEGHNLHRRRHYKILCFMHINVITAPKRNYYY